MAMNRSNYDYEEIIEHFGKEKIMKRFSTVEEYLNSFVARSKYKENVEISYSLLNQAVIDYFADIDRLKNFHHIFIENLKYVLRYRIVTPQTPETMPEAYTAGRVFERSIGIND